jgi:RNA polymerase sigma-70 factor (ECF subfamily)
MRADIDEAIGLLKNGERHSLERAIGLLQRSVFAFGMRVCGQRQDAEDTMQEVLIKAIPYLPRFDNSKALTTWLYKVAKNRCLMSRRKSKFAPHEELSLDELMPDRKELERLQAPYGVGPADAAIRRETAHRLREAVQKLPPHYRIILVLRDMEGFSDEEVSEITGLRPATVRVRLHRARLFVRRQVMPGGRKEIRPPRKNGSAFSRPAPCRRMFAGLSDYLDGELDDFSCEEIETHLERCAPCKTFLETLERSIQQCRANPPERLEPKRAAALRKELLGAYGRALAMGGK